MRDSNAEPRVRPRFFSSSLVAAVGVALAAPVAAGACHGSTTGIGVNEAGMASDTGAMTKADSAPHFDSGQPATGQVDVLTQHNDIARSGQNLSEQLLTTANVTTATFGKLRSMTVDGYIWGQPLVVSNYQIDGQAREVLIVTTAHNSVYAFDANTGDSLWTTAFPPPVPSTAIRNGAGTLNILVDVGILSTPVIDRTNNLVYVTCKTYVNSVQQLWLYVLDLATGASLPGSPVEITASAPGTGYDAGPTLTLDAPHHAQRPALLLLDGTIYVAFASHEDWQPYHGWILSYRYDTQAGTLAQTGVFITTPDGTEGGIWQSGQGLVSDGISVYAVTSNGSVTIPFLGKSYGEAFLRLSADLSAVNDWFIPYNYESLTRADEDLGAGGPLLIPGTSPALMVGGGKQGVLYLVDTTHMGNLGTVDDMSTQAFQATPSFYGAPVVWTGTGEPRLYVWGVGDSLREYVMDKGLFNTTAVATSGSVQTVLVPGQDPVGALSVSSNGNVTGTGIVWAAKPVGSPDHTTVPGILYAFDATTLAPLWNSTQNAARDSYGSFAKFVAPTVANGKVFVATDSGEIAVYGLLSDAGQGQ
jgi:outer membrane protein assembly factor BamB